MMKKTLLRLVCFSTMVLFLGCSREVKEANDQGVSKEVSDSQDDKGDEDQSIGEQETSMDEELTEEEDKVTETIVTELTPEEEMKLIEEAISNVPLKAAEPISYDFDNASVHDPSIIKTEDGFYVFGSHLAVGKSTDLINWSMVANGVTKNNKIIPDAMTEMEEAFTWAKTKTFWAPDVIQLEDGRYYMYYCNCEGSSPLAALGIAVADHVEGPYKDLGIILKSGMSGEASENGDKYNANIHPNAIDPALYYDTEGRLWMMYGSYSGGIYVLEMDPKTGFPLEEGYGKKILGKNHLRIEGAFVEYSPETEYYYMFLSFGGLDARGAYNMRVARSKTPDGPYYDPMGNDMIDCKGPEGSFFDDKAAEPFGAKIMGNFHWTRNDGEYDGDRAGYVSPGHNSTYYDEETGRYFLIFHTRYDGKGEGHTVRTHQMFLNEEGWFVVAPYRYIGETIGTYEESDVVGPYKMLNHGRDTTAKVKQSEDILLREDHTVIGALHGTWELKDGNKAVLDIDGVKYHGVFLEQWDEYGKKYVMTFSVLSSEGISLWGSGYEARENADNLIIE